jgi:transposase
VQTDDYAGYHGVCSDDNITQLGCWAQARRKFIETHKVHAKQKKAGKADVAISMIAKLYAVEKRGLAYDADERYRLRQAESIPQLDSLREWLDKTRHTALPKGLLGKALAYLDKNWEKLTVYTQDGRLSIDNNLAENAIRPFVVGRKNWLFSATVSGAKSSANLYGLIETARANKLEPIAYLRKVFTDLPRASTVDELERLLPWKVDFQDRVY